MTSKFKKKSEGLRGAYPAVAASLIGVIFAAMDEARFPEELCTGQGMGYAGMIFGAVLLNAIAYFLTQKSFVCEERAEEGSRGKEMRERAYEYAGYATIFLLVAFLTTMSLLFWGVYNERSRYLTNQGNTHEGGASVAATPINRNALVPVDIVFAELGDATGDDSVARQDSLLSRYLCQ